MNPQFITSTFTIKGYTIKENLGMVTGITVRSRSLIGAIGANIQSLIGGNITLYTKMCSKARQDAFDLMIAQADDLQANGVIGVRYDTTEIISGVTEVFCYGTAVKLDKERAGF